MFAATGAGGGGFSEWQATSDNKIAPASVNLFFAFIMNPLVFLIVGNCRRKCGGSKATESKARTIGVTYNGNQYQK